MEAQPHQSDIRQKHLRKTDPAKLATDLVVSMIEKPIDPSTANVVQFRETRRTLRTFVERQQLPRLAPSDDPAFLQAVAHVYRENIDGKPTKAVGETFNVQSRMASKYVEVARQRGYLPRPSAAKRKPEGTRHNDQQETATAPADQARSTSPTAAPGKALCDTR